MNIPRTKTLQAGAVLLFACLLTPLTFAQTQKSIISLDEPISAQSQAVLPNGKPAPVPPANFHSFRMYWTLLMKHDTGHRRNYRIPNGVVGAEGWNPSRPLSCVGFGWVGAGQSGLKS